ncbi:MAG TPA: hypothetical protein VIL55_11390 [Naasia sp.]|jgi:hypothetical protein
MAEPFVPATSSNESERTPAAEPGPGAPEPEAPEEPDVLEAGAEEGVTSDDAAARETPFRTPTPGDKLSPDELSLDTP